MLFTYTRIPTLVAPDVWRAQRASAGAAAKVRAGAVQQTRKSPPGGVPGGLGV